ncbi:MAG: M60 family metallopeptidase [Myxococcaceae bacterium]|jgi:hypothetical protein|nr:M60 family metallopeptidase [Myxococcaceae bacterium]
MRTRTKSIWALVLVAGCTGVFGNVGDLKVDPEKPAETPGPEAPAPETPTPTLACPAPLTLPPTEGCNGILLTDPDSAEFRAPGIVATTGPGGSPAFRIGVNDEDHILVKDTPCLRLGKDGTDFSLSMWLKVHVDPLDVQIIGTGSGIGSGTPGFGLGSRNRDDGQVELVFGTGPLSDRTGTYHDLGVSPPFKRDEWVHVVLTYDSNGPGTAARFNLWLNLWHTTFPAPFQVYQPNLKVGDQGYARWGVFEVSELRSYTRVLTDNEIKAQVLEKAGLAGLSIDELKQSTERLLAHVSGTTVLPPAELGTEVARFERHSILLDTDAQATQRALELVAAWEARAGALFMTSATERGVNASASPGDAAYPALAQLKVQQAVFDGAFTPTALQHCAASFEGKAWRTSEYFPGAVSSAPDTSKSHQVRVLATVPAAWGRPECYSAAPVVRPTGLYLSPGGVAEVHVPDSMVGAGFTIQVGAHIGNHGHKATFSRMPRVTKTFPITSKVTRIGSPLGGGVYVLVPYLANQGTQTVTVRGGVVEAPFFSAKEVDKMTNDQWRARRTAPAPWADFESDKYLMQVPSSWIFAFEDPVALMEKWDRAMDGFSEIWGYAPDKRNRHVLYELVDTDIQWGVYGVGYPMTNNPFNPRQKGNGNADHWLLRDPMANEIDFHELSHCALPSMFSGETEAIVNFPYAYVRHIKFGDTFNASFARSMGWSFGDPGRTPDEAALDRMITVSFRSGQPRNESNTEQDEVRYQHRGYAHYADIARTFGWEAYTRFLHQEHLDWMTPPASDGLSGNDSRTLRMSIAARTDLTPLIHFWGVHPDDPTRLKAAMVARGLTPSPLIRTLLERYLTLIPRTNAEFLAAAGMRGLNCSPNDSPHYGCGWWAIWRARYGSAEGMLAQSSLRSIIQRYYP